MSNGRNDRENRGSSSNGSGDGHNLPSITYGRTLLGFVSRIQNPIETDEEAEKYTFVSGIHRPLYCNPRIGADVPEEIKTNYTKESQSTLFGLRIRAAKPIPRFKAERTEWGIDLRKVETTIIPYNIHSVRKQQKEMSPVIQWINDNQNEFAHIRPAFVSNRYILKKIMVLSPNDRAFTFTAERINGTIFLKEGHAAYNNRGNGHQCPGALFESIMLRNSENIEAGLYDVNETTYGIQLGDIHGISVLFSGEIDGFWGEENGNWNAATEENIEILDQRITEVKTIHRDLFFPRMNQNFIAKMSDSYAQCVLSGIHEILYGIMDDKKTVQLQVIKLSEIFTEMQKRSSKESPCPDPYKYFSRVYGTLKKILEVVSEDSPIMYLCTATTHWSFVDVTEISSLSTLYPNPPTKK